MAKREGKQRFIEIENDDMGYRSEGDNDILEDFGISWKRQRENFYGELINGNNKFKNTYFPDEHFNKSSTHTFDSKKMKNSTYSARNLLFPDISTSFSPVETLANGNCFYRSLSTFLTGEPKFHHQLRLRIADFVYLNEGQFWKYYHFFNFSSCDDFMASILKNKVWAGPFQIMAAASYLGRKIFVFGCHLEKKCR